jgi:Phytochelatin synthase
MSRWCRSLVGFLCLFVTESYAQTLPLPGNLIDLRSQQGEEFLLEAKSHEAYFAISIAFVTQKNQAYCGVASMVMALNAIQAPAPTTPEYQPFHTFTQENLLDDRAETILPRAVLDRQGMTLDQLGQLLELHPVKAEIHHATEHGLDEFRKSAAEYLATKDHFVIVNYLRKSIGQQVGGHISPLAAYDPKADRFLIMDVARYKYPPVWVTASDLFNAMNTADASNDNRTRGYVLISNAAVGTAAKP